MQPTQPETSRLLRAHDRPAAIVPATDSFPPVPRSMSALSQKLHLPKGRIHIHHLTAEQKNILKTVAAMQEMSMSAFIAEATLAVLRKLRMHGPKEVKHFLKDKVVDDEMQELRMQIP